jgi:hypothetical protein
LEVQEVQLQQLQVITPFFQQLLRQAAELALITATAVQAVQAAVRVMTALLDQVILQVHHPHKVTMVV